MPPMVIWLNFKWFRKRPVQLDRGQPNNYKFGTAIRALDVLVDFRGICNKHIGVTFRTGSHRHNRLSLEWLIAICSA